MTETDHKMLNAEREQRIVELLHERPVMTVAELGDRLGVSPATVRRDLQAMHERKLLRRVRGGAARHHPLRTEPLFQDKQSLHSQAKRRIAEAAMDLLEDKDRIYLDGGSTVLALARLLDRKHELTVVTNSMVAAAELMMATHHLIMVGGELRRLSRTLVGPLSLSVVESLHLDKAFMGTIGLTLQDGMTTTDAGEALTKERIMKRASQVILLADSSKLGFPSFVRSGGLDDIDILVTEKIDRKFRSELESRGLRVVVANETP